ncbi:MAG: 6-hydroxymethylpterin diphosphokinase MptE-like protein [Spirochaetota bacterium]|nr:6-hydroxymethylpterin diphosphokinase MptE-like protein [Spirochaetota bacterium]
MISLYDANLSIIRETSPHLHTEIINSRDSCQVNVVDSRDGNKVPELALDGRRVFIHSKFDPIKEAKRLVAEIDVDRFDLFIVFGFGFAYQIEELLQLINDDALILVIEKDLWMIRAALRHRDLTAILRDNRLKFLVDPDEEAISDALRGKSTYRVSFIAPRGAFQVDPEYYNNIRNIARSYLSTKEVNIATLSKFEKIWSANIARNIQAFYHYPGANIFYNQFKDVPAIIVGAGPSLYESLEFVQANAGRALIIAVDTSYKILKRYGIEPHFCITVDPQVVNARYFEGDEHKQTILIADPTVHPSVFRLFKGDIAITGMAFKMMKWIEDVAGERGELAYGGSVATNAYDFAKRIGASPIVLVGQDLAFTNGLAHARGSYLDEEIYLRTYRLYSIQMFNRYQLTALPKIYVDGIKGDRVHTNQKMMIFLSWFEKRGDDKIINATTNGAIIKGVRHIASDDICFNDAEDDIFYKINSIYNSSIITPPISDNIRMRLLEVCQEMLGELNSLLPILERAVSLSLELVSLIKMNMRDQGKLDYILRKLSEVDKVVEKRDTLKDMISFTIQRVIHTITEGYKIDDKDDSLTDDELVAKRSNYLYTGLLEGSLYNKKIIHKMTALLG